MASIFLSYSRNDAAKAARIAHALENAGHSVWWDEELHAGSRFSAEIETALRDSEFVVVLWSSASIQSVWVQDEAATGRDAGKLVPVLIEKVQPPLGFRQFHAISIRTFRGDGRAIQPLLEAVSQGKVGSAPYSPPRRKLELPKWVWAALIAFATALVAYLGFLRPGENDESRSIVIQAAKGSDPARSAEMARTIAADLAQFRTGPLGSLTILRNGDGESKQADYRVEVGVSESGNDLRADVALIEPKNSRVLWTTTVEGQSRNLADMREQALAKLGDVLACAADADRQREPITHEILGLYLDGCGRMSDLEEFESNKGAVSIFQQITSKAPQFAPAWANLALIEVRSIPGRTPQEQPVLARSARNHLAKAKKLDPTLPEVFAAEANLQVNDAKKNGLALAILDRGLELRPDSALLHSERSAYLALVGRMSEAIEEAADAVQLNPMSPVVRDRYISSLAYGGRTGAAFAELAKAEEIWPGSTVLQQARYRLDLRYGDPKVALQILQARGGGDQVPIPMDIAWQRFIEARINPTPAKVELAIDAFRERYRRDRADIPGYLQALGTFGRVDEAFAAVEPAETLDSMMVSTDTLFRSHMASIRYDPRFIGLAARLGLLAYWHETGIWPDFCREPKLPYDCKKEASAYLKPPAVR